MSKKSREERKALKKARHQTAFKDNVIPLKDHFSLKEIQPLTNKQCEVFEEYIKGKNLLLCGSAGTGKSFLSIYLALKDIYENQKYDKIVIFRSSTPTMSQGFLPGNLKEKNQVLESPYHKICSDLYNRSDAYTILKNKNIIEFSTTSYVRGITLDNCIIIFDEFQSATDHEINSTITRMGQNSKIILCGDIKQNDLCFEKYKTSGAFNIIKIFKKMKEVSTIEFSIEDVVRSGFIKNYLLTREALEEKGLLN